VVSTLIVLLLAAAIILWRPPFHISIRLKNLIIPIILTVIITLVLVLGSIFRDSESQLTKSPISQPAASEAISRQTTAF